MEKVDVSRGINDTIDLLGMLEYLSSGISTGRIHGSEAPWSGIAVSIRQSRNILLGVRENLGRNDLSETVYRNVDAFDNTHRESIPSPSLADRVKQISAGGGSRTREMANNSYSNEPTPGKNAANSSPKN